MQAFLDGLDSKLLKPWPPDQLWGSKRGSKFNIEYIGKMFTIMLVSNLISSYS